MMRFGWWSRCQGETCCRWRTMELVWGVGSVGCWECGVMGVWSDVSVE